MGNHEAGRQESIIDMSLSQNTFLIVLITFICVGAIYAYFIFTTNPEPPHVLNSEPAPVTSPSEDVDEKVVNKAVQAAVFEGKEKCDYVVSESRSFIFMCRSACYGDSNSCSFEVISKKTNLNSAKEEIFVEDSPSSVLVSPDSKHILIIRPGANTGIGVSFEYDTATVVNTESGTMQDIYVADANTSLGLLSELPAFYGRGTWSDSSTVLLKVYKKTEAYLTGDVEAVPISVINIPIVE